MQTARLHKAVKSNLSIPRKLLRQAHLEDVEELEAEVRPREIRITPNSKKLEAKPLTKESATWKWGGKGSADFHGRDHDEALYG